MKTACTIFTLKSSLGDFNLNQSQVLVGSSEKCDIRINDKSVSHYHAIITVQGDSVTIMDLNSTNGILIGGRVAHGTQAISVGDHLCIGSIDFHLHEQVSEAQVIDLNVDVKEQKVDSIAVPACFDEDLVFIDDEYCNIDFGDDNSTVKDLSAFKKGSISFDDYIDLEPIDPIYISDKEEEVVDCLIVTTAINGNILEQKSFPLSSKTIYASKTEKKDSIIVDLLTSKKEPLLHQESGSYKFAALEGFSDTQEQLSDSNDAPISISLGNYQIFAERGHAPKSIVQPPLFFRTKEFYKQTSIVFASIFLPFLFLLLVNPEVLKPEEEKKVAIIYKKPTKSQVDKKDHSSQKVTDPNKNTGHKEKTNNPKKIANKKKGQKKKVNKKVAKAPAPKKAQKVAKVKPVKAKAPVKAYDFKFAANTKSMFKNSPTEAAAATTTSSSLSSNSTAVSTSDTKVAGTSGAAIGNLGSDANGGENSFGSKGLSSRSGKDSSYIQTKTVVLGSMDPDLLRKILRRYLPQFRHCYQQELTYNDESIKGVVDLNFKISGSGSVNNMKITAKDKRFSKKGIDCMKNVLSIIKFPAPKGGGTVAVRQPLNFFSDKK